MRPTLLKGGLLRIKLAILLTLILSPGLCRAQPLAERVPSDVVLYIGWHGVSGSMTGYEQSHLKAMVDASQISQLLHICIPQMIHKLAISDPQTTELADDGMDIESSLWAHPTAIYLEGIDAAAPIPKIAILCQAGADSPALADKINKLLKMVNGNLLVRCVSTDDMVVISTFETSDHPANSLTTNKEFQADLATLGKDPILCAYVDGAALSSTIDSAIQFTGNPQLAQMWPGVRTALGLDGFKSLAWTSGFQGRDWADQAVVDAPAPRQGLLNIGGDPISDDILKLIPESSTTAGAGSFDLSAILPGIQGILQQVQPNSAAQMNQGLSAINQMLGMNVEDDLLALFGQKWAFYIDPQTNGEGPLGAVIINHPSDANKLSDSIIRVQKFISAVAAQQLRKQKMTLEFRQFDAGDIQIHYIATPMFSPSWAVKDDMLFIGLEPQSLAGAMEKISDGKSIFDNPDYQEVQKRLAGPAKFDSFMFADLPQTIPQGYQGWVGASRTLLGLGDMFGLHSPPLLVPPLQKIMAETEASGSISWSDDAGLHMKSISSYPGSDLLGAGQAMSASSIGEMSVMASVILPSLNRARGTANHVASANNLRQIGAACMMYSNDNKGALPPDLGTLVKTEDIAISVFVNPESGTTLPPGSNTMSPDDIATWVNNNSDYVLLAAGKNTRGMDPGTVIAHEKIDPTAQSVNILFADNHVEYIVMAQAQTIIQQGKR
jgi:prepilin-type processing-associated H-X9-DG protein